MANIQPRLPSWDEFLDSHVKELLPHYTGTTRERMAQALKDMSNSYAENIELKMLILGGSLNYVQKERLYQDLGYGSMDEYLVAERVGGLGRTQCEKYMKVALHTAPPNLLTAPTLQAQVLDTNANKPLLSPDFVARVGIERSNAVVRKWPKKTPQQRQELLTAAQNASTKDFYDTVYEHTDKPSFSVDGDKILLWRDSVGTVIATLVFPINPQDRQEFLERLGVIPRLF